MADTVESLENLKKEVFADGGVKDLVPDGVKLVEKIKFNEAKREGKKFVDSVRLAYPMGFTHALGDGTEGAFDLNDATRGTVGRAEIQGYQTVLRDLMSYEDAADASGSKQAFAQGAGFVIAGMQVANKMRLEGELWHGQMGLGKIEGTPSTSGSNKVITIETATWASGLWVGCEGMQLDAYNGASKINSNAALVLVEVDPDAKTIEVSGNSTDLSNLADGYDLYYKGAYGKEMAGVFKVLTNSSTLWNIDAGTYKLWTATSYDVGGQISFDIVSAAVAKAMAKGFMGKAELFVSPTSWNYILNDIAALRKTEKGEVKKVEIGHEEIEFVLQDVRMKIIASTYIKEGNGAGLTMPNWSRVGSADVSFNRPGFQNEKMFFDSIGKAGIELRTYFNQAGFCRMPGRQLYLSGIVNGA